MSVQRYPVLAWEDADGAWTAALVEFPQVAAVGDSTDHAISQLKDLLAWQAEHQPWMLDAPDFHSPVLFPVKVPVRAEHRVDRTLPPGWPHDVPAWMATGPSPTPAAWRREGVPGDARPGRRYRAYAAQEPLTLRVTAVRGHQQNGLVACSVPLLGLHFYAAEGDSLKDLVVHYVQEALAGQPPEALTRYFPPGSAVLDHITVRCPREPVTADTAIPTDLAAACSAVGDSGFRRAFMRSFGRKRELERLKTRLGDERTSLLVVGPPGVGKTSLLVDAVAALERRGRDVEKDDDARTRHRFYMTGAGRLVAGMRYLGQWQERCERIIEQLQRVKGVLCIERLLDLVRVGGDGPTDSLAAFLAPYVERGEVRLVVEATADEVDASRRLLPGFVDLFAVMPLEAFPTDQESSVLAAVADALARHHRVPVADPVPAVVARLFRRFAPYAGFPGRAVTFLRQLATEREGAPRRPGDTVTADEAIQAFSSQTGLPQMFLRDELTLDEDEVLESFRARIVGQDEACAAATRVVMTFKAGLCDPERPLSVLLFCGPTGVGKTEMARALARWLFGADAGDEGGEKRLVRLDMSEYAGWGAADRLLGDSAGEPGVLIRRLREQPFSVVLLDEIEKAHPDIFDVLLGVFDEGRLRDAHGRVTTFRSAVIVMTSNLGSDQLRSLGFRHGGEPSYEAEAMRFFRPEFFNRLDSVVRFHSLSAEHVLELARRELEGLACRAGLRERRIALSWTPRLVDRLAFDGYDPLYGARPLQRALDTLVAAPLARFLAGHPDFTDCTLHLDLGPTGQVEVDLG